MRGKFAHFQMGGDNAIALRNADCGMVMSVQ